MITSKQNVQPIHDYFQNLGAGPLQHQGRHGILYQFVWGGNLIVIGEHSAGLVEIFCGFGDKKAVDQELGMMEALMDQKLIAELEKENEER